MVHPNVIPKVIVSMNVKPIDVEIYVGKKIMNKQEFVVRGHMPNGSTWRLHNRGSTL